MMAHFDIPEVQHGDQNRLAFFGQNQQHLVDQIKLLSNALSQVSTNQPTLSHPNLNLPQPPPFLGVATELPECKMKLFQILHGTPNTSITS